MCVCVCVCVCVCARTRGQSCLTLCDWSLPGFSVHGIFQARIMERVAAPYSRGILPTQGSSPCFLCLLHWRVGSLPPAPHAKPFNTICVSLQKTFLYMLSSKKLPNIAAGLMVRRQLLFPYNLNWKERKVGKGYVESQDSFVPTSVSHG